MLWLSQSLFAYIGFGNIWVSPNLQDADIDTPRRTGEQTSSRIRAARGFLRFFEERCQRQGIFSFDEPESALSPARQMEFLKLIRRMENIGHCQIIMATHSPMLMAYPNARLLRLTKYGLEPVTVKETDHYKVMREFCDDPKGFVEAAIEE
jgi:predicted ATPase